MAAMAVGRLIEGATDDNLPGVLPAASHTSLGIPFRFQEPSADYIVTGTVCYSTS